MEEVAYISDDHAKVCGMMHLLVSGHFESKDHLYQTLKDVYSNFTLIRKAVFAVLDDMDAKYPGDEPDPRFSTRELITFCRCSLKRILEEDGITIRESRARLLSEIELHLLEIIKYCISRLSPSDDSSVPRPGRIKGRYHPMIRRMADDYVENSSICHHLITYDTVLEFLDQFLEDSSSTFFGDRKYYLNTVRSYLELLIEGGIHGKNLEKLLFAVENAAYEMARCSFLVEIRYDGEFLIPKPCVGILRVLVLPSDDSYTQLMSYELMRIYLVVVKENFEELLQDRVMDHKSAVNDQIRNLHEGLSFLMCLLETFLLRHYSKHERDGTIEDISEHEMDEAVKHDLQKLSNIRLDLQTLARNVGYIILSCFDNPEIEETSFGFIDLIKDIDVIKGEIIKTICCTVLEETEHESTTEDQLGSLILVLQNFKEFMDREPGLIVTWKDQENLVLFILYLINNNIRGGNRIDNDDFSQNLIQIDVTLINCDDMNKVLISAQVVAFRMACNYLLRRYGRFRYWELYPASRDRNDVYSHMHVGVLKALVFSLDDTSTPPLTDEQLIGYVEFVQESLIEVPKYLSSAPPKEDIDILRVGLTFLVHFLISYRDEKRLSHVKVYFLDLLNNIGSAIYSYLSDWLNGTMAIGQRIELSDLVVTLNLVRFKAEGFLNLLTLNTIGRESPKTDQLGSLNLLLENCKGLLECETNLIVAWKDQFRRISIDLVSFKSFISTTGSGDDESQNLCNAIVDAAHIAEYLLTTFSVGICPVWSTSLWVPELMEHVDLIKKAVMDVNKKTGNGKEKEIGTAVEDTSHISSLTSLVPTLPDLVVGFTEEMKQIKERLNSDLRQLDVISIIGMPGLGKTTLARKVYEDRLAVSHFEVRAWCSVSQEYNTNELFLTILSSTIEITDEIKRMNEIELSTKVYQELTGRRYLIVLDDIWSIDAFTELMLFFPDSHQGSRIMLTSRIKVTGSMTEHGDPIEPGLLTDEESWNLLERKVYGEGKCPLEMYEIGNEIARKCRGLPLVIIVVAGILAKSGEKQQFWKQVAGNLSSYRDSETHVKTVLELSYKHLPHSLKPMFLYLGAFPEDAEIHADRLMRLWIGEGFVQKMESSSLESEAEKNLMDLIDRSLVMVAKRRWDGRVKSCQVHDLLRDMSLAKAKEEKFMQQVRVHRELPYPVMYRRRLSIILDRNDETTSTHLAAYKDLLMYAIAPPIYSILFFPVGSEMFWSKDGDLVPVINSLKLLKVFGAEIFELTQSDLDMGLIMLVHLKYASFGGKFEHIPPSISRLRSLETLIINVNLNWPTSIVPETIWEMTKLRHLHINPAAYFIVPENPLTLESLQTLSTPFAYLGEEEKLFRKVPGVKKLKWDFIEVDCSSHFTNCTSHPFPNVDSLIQLESLKASFRGNTRLISEFKLPSTLKKLSIVGFRLNWSQVPIFMALPNLEALKLKINSVWGDFWEMGADDVFENLRFLKLQDLEIKGWSASADNFPSLKQLVLDRCRKLETIPSDLGEFYSLQKVEVIRCGDSAVNMAKEIKKKQEENENESLKFYIYQPQEENYSNY